ncbi:MAG: hypothetical protein QG597_5101 [Actinomycetota bacterium]|jgi:hypothetical protein|nr:hypothetical protein [Actinomycetota bacterium]
MNRLVRYTVLRASDVAIRVAADGLQEVLAMSIGDS